MKQANKKSAAAKASTKAAAAMRTQIPFRGYTPTEKEKEAVDQWLARVQSRAPLPDIAVEKTDSGAWKIGLDHPAEGYGQMLFTNAIGATSQAFAMKMLDQIVAATCEHGTPSPYTAEFVASAMQGIGPKDETESMLAAQMAMTHLLAMKTAGRLHDPARVTQVMQQDSAINALTKLTRTFTMQMEALKRYRTGGEQKVTVQHVNVNDGGQAIVGDVTPITVGRG